MLEMCLVVTFHYENDHFKIVEKCVYDWIEGKEICSHCRNRSQGNVAKREGTSGWCQLKKCHVSRKAEACRNFNFQTSDGDSHEEHLNREERAKAAPAVIINGEELSFTSALEASKAMINNKLKITTEYNALNVEDNYDDCANSYDCGYVACLSDLGLWQDDECDIGSIKDILVKVKKSGIRDAFTIRQIIKETLNPSTE